MKFTREELKTIKEALHNYSHIIFRQQQKFYFSQEYKEVAQKELNKIDKIALKIK